MEIYEPLHVGLIPDGSRRYASAKGISLEEAYLLGAGRVTDFVKWGFRDFGVREISVYGLSYDNLVKRGEENSFILKAQEREFRKWLDDHFFAKQDVKIVFVGESSDLPAGFWSLCNEVVLRTQDHSTKQLNILVAYSARLEALRTVRKLLEEKGELLHEKDREVSIKRFWQFWQFANGLQVENELDLVIRAGGRRRLSGFLPFQTQHAELFFLDKLWPEFEKSDFAKIIEGYASAVKMRGA